MAINRYNAVRNLKTIEMEIALMQYLNHRINLIVPNVEWGAGLHECDLLVITKAGYAWEIEIKISMADLKKDRQKWHGHVDRKGRIKHLYFAVPEHLLPIDEYIPERAGIIAVRNDLHCKKIRNAKIVSTYKWSDRERYGIARLGAMRILTLKKRLLNS